MSALETLWERRGKEQRFQRAVEQRQGRLIGRRQNLPQPGTVSFETVVAAGLQNVALLGINSA